MSPRTIRFEWSRPSSTTYDLGTLGFNRFEPAATGRPAYDPATLLKLYL